MIGLIAAFTANFLGAAINPTFIKLGTRELSPLVYTCVRFFVAFLIFFPFSRPRQLLTILKRPKVLIGSCIFAGNLILFSYGIQQTSAIMSQILFATTTLLVAIIEFILFKKRLHKTQIIGAITAFIGLAFLIGQSISSADTASFGTLSGNLMVFAAVLCWAMYLIWSKTQTQNIPSTAVVHTNYLMVALITSIMLFVQPIDYATIKFSHTALLSIGIVAIGGTALMFYLLQIAIKKLGPFKVSLFAYMGPLFTTLTAIPLLGERVTPQLVVGGVAIVCGVFYATAWDTIRAQSVKLTK